MAEQLDQSRKKVYLDGVSGVNKLLGTSMTVLVILAIIVEFELHDKRVRIAQIETQIAEQQTLLSNARRKIELLLESINIISPISLDNRSTL